MNYKLFIAACITAATATTAAAANNNAARYVNPLIGTGAVENSLSGNTFPGALVPWGMVQLSPDTRHAPDWDCASGYDYNHSHIVGFSHTHLSGTGVADLFDVMLMPFTGNIARSNADYASRFAHAEESARAGFYSVRLADYNVRAELTATARVGFHRYSYPASAQRHLLIDLDHSRKKGDWGTRVLDAQLRVVDSCTIEGYRIITGWVSAARKVCFQIKLSQPIASITSLTDEICRAEPRNVHHFVDNGSNVKAVLTFAGAASAPLLVKVALSPVSVSGARSNMQAELPQWDFDSTAQRAQALWDEALSTVDVDGTDEEKTIFYTALYHTMVHPNLLCDANGSYSLGNMHDVQPNAGEPLQHSTFSLWDTYRALHPLYTLLQPERNAAFVQSLLRSYDAGGFLPVWQLWGQENYCMIGNHAIPAIVDAVRKGAIGIDVERAYEAVKNSSLRTHRNAPFELWEKYGYMPEDLQTQSVSLTLEMAYDDWCVAQLAKQLGRSDDYARFAKRATFYKNLFNAQSKFFQARRSNGQWLPDFNPYQYGANGGHPFTEGNAWQYFWYVPHDVDNLIALAGGRESFCAKLDTFFSANRHEALNSNASGFIGQYAHGNEPSHHVAYLYAMAGQPEKTQRLVLQIMRTLYNSSSSGYAGNEDCGAMSAWYVWSALGFYPVNPANGMYVIGAPLHRKATLHLHNGKTFTVIAHRSAPQQCTVKKITLNGKIYTGSTIPHALILQGGAMEFYFENEK